jgi:hypothetical protein
VGSVLRFSINPKNLDFDGFGLVICSIFKQIKNDDICSQFYTYYMFYASWSLHASSFELVIIYKILIGMDFSCIKLMSGCWRTR